MSLSLTDCLMLMIVATLQQRASPLELKIGYINPRYPDHRGVAVTYGINKFFNNFPQYRDTLNITITHYQSKCDPAIGMTAVIKAVEKDHMDALVGMSCSEVCEPTGYYLNAYNMASFASGCTSAKMFNKTAFPTVVRVFPPTNRLAEAVGEVCQHYDWHRVMIYVSNYRCDFQTEFLLKILKKLNVTVAELRQVSLNATDEEMRDFLEIAKTRGRIFIICLTYEPLLRFMTLVRDMRMDTPDYVYLHQYLATTIISYTPWLINATENITEEEIQNRKELFRPLRVLDLADIDINYTKHYNDIYEEYYGEEPWNTDKKELGTDLFPIFNDDAAYLYMKAVTSLIDAREDYRNGRMLLNVSKNMSFHGASGYVQLDEDAERLANYELYRFDSAFEHYIPFARIAMYKEAGNRFTEEALALWGTEDGKAPPDTPHCGFDGKLCPGPISTTEIVLSCLGFIVVLSSVGGLALLYRQRRLEAHLLEIAWKVEFIDIKFTSKKMGSMHMSSKASSLFPKNQSDSVSMATTRGGDLMADYGLYKSQPVQIVKVQKYSVSLDKNDMMEMKNMRQMVHENINTFIGACVEPDKVCLLFNLCSKGSLADILENDDIQLDWMFKSALMQDLINGMAYLHSSFLRSHGRLSSANCLVDSRWVLKITGFGLKVFHVEETEQDNYAHYRDKLWTAPELLRLPENHRPFNGTQKADVFSFSIVLQEVLFRNMPYFVGDLSPKEVIEKVIKEGYRPPIPEEELGRDQEEIVRKMKECWAENPDERPTFNALKQFLKKLNRGRKANIMDNMLAKLERYASNLEELVGQRTAELLEEKKKTDGLLYRMLPRVVAEELKRGRSVCAELHDRVTVYFSDIVDFTVLCSTSTPMQVVQLLNDLYTRFDGVIENHDVYKVETIGDAYMLVSGLPHKNRRHVAEVADVSLNLQEAIIDFRIRHLPVHRLRLRIGIHTGPCAAGVVGLTMPRYCLFGDTVNMASRMESTGEALKIHMSESAADALHAYPEYVIMKRGQIEVKGKGLVTTYWLNGKISKLESR